MPGAHFDGETISVATTSLGTCVAAVPNGSSTPVTQPSTSSGGYSSSASSGSPGYSSSSSSGGSDECAVMCEGPTNVSGGIGCDCNTTCHGVTYKIECRCGACTCTQNGVPTATTSVDVSVCSSGAEGLLGSYNTVCNYPAAPNQFGGGGPTSNDAGGVCP